MINYWEEPWNENEYEEKLSEIKKRGKLLVSDLIGFKRIQVLNDLFNKNYKKGYFNFGKCFLNYSNNERIWFPFFIKHKEWDNTISKDGEYINQKYIGNKIIDIEKNKEINDKSNRYVFAKCKDNLGYISYRFIGVFIYDKYNNGITIYKRVSNELIF